MTDLWIAGLGIQTVSQITRQVEHALRASREILYLDTGVATKSYLEGLCPRITSLFEQSYAEDRPRVSAYEHMAIRVVEAALDHPPVTFAIHGHPLIAVHPPFLVMEMAKALDLRVEVLPGISALDTLFADLRVDPVVHGVQMFEATDLLLRRRPLQSDVPAILWQVGTLETALHSQRVSKPERFARFVDHLKRFYPARHPVTAIYSSPHALLTPVILRFALEDMRHYAEDLHAGFTLYVPPAIGRPIQDCVLVTEIYSVEHLRSITR
jgi:precorrin-3B methylase